MPDISIKSQAHRAYGVRRDNFYIYLFILVSIATIYI